MPQGPESDPSDVDWHLLTRYLTGELSPAERVRVERWFASEPRHGAQLEELRAVWEAAKVDTSRWDTERAIASLRARAEGVVSVPAIASRPPRRRSATRISTPHPAFRTQRSLLPIAAGIVAIMLSGSFVLHKRYSEDQAARPAAAQPAAAQVTDVRTHRGQQAEVQLTDGSRVILGPSTRLSYASDFNQRARVVSLDGEAYFEVAHNSTTPFRVETARGVAENIGTAFVVRIRETSALQVVVSEGAVVLRAASSVGGGGQSQSQPRDSLILRKAQLGRVLPNGELEFRSGVAPDKYLAWTHGQLAFEDTPLTDVAADLSRWYDADVRVADPKLALRHFTGQFERRSLSEAVRVVAAVTGVSARREVDGWVFQ